MLFYRVSKNVAFAVNIVLLFGHLTFATGLPTFSFEEIETDSAIPKHTHAPRRLSRRDGLGTGGIIGLAIGAAAIMVLILLCVTKLPR